MNSVPIPKDTQDFQFKQSAVRSVCESIKNIPSACNLIVADAKRGLLYTATDDKLTVQKSDSSSNEWRLDYKLPYPVSRLSMSCDYSYLAVTFNRSTAHIYSASSLAKNSLELLHEIQLSHSSQNVFAYDLKWNPAIPGMFCTVASDHSIGSFQVKIEQKTTVGVVALERIQNVEATCVAWSPKGKQLVVGCKNGNIIQLKPELKVMRTISGPSPSIGELITILWISNYQFCAAYYDRNERRVNVLIVDAPKGADAKPTFTCYEDITFGMPDNDAEYFPRYYFDYVPEWNLIIAASSSSSEVAILGSLDNGTTWEQWQLIDSGRAQLPFVRTSESYPVGMTIDRSSTVVLPWGPESTLPHPVPVLHLFGTSGQIVSCHMVNLLPNCPALCTPPSEPVQTDQINTTITSEMTFVPHSVATSTPRPKQTESLIERPKVAIPPPNFFSEPAKSVAAPIAALVNLQMSAPPVELKIPKPKPVDKPAAPQQIESKLLSKQVPAPAPAPASAAPAPVSAPAPTPSAVEKISYDDSLCWRAFREEQIHFEKELQTILEPQVFDIGTEEEREKLILQSEQVNNFIQELNETTNTLSNEISYLNSLLLQSFAWLEETKSKQSSGNLTRDHHDKSKINELQRRFSHLQSQLIQAMKVLDSRWADNEQQEMAKFKIPGLEYIYQCLTRYNQLIQINKKRIDEQTKKWKSLSRGNKILSLNKSLSKLHISSNSYGGNTEDDMIEMRCKAVADNTKNFTLQKQNKLRDILMQTEPRVIKNINPSNVYGRLEATLSALALQSTTPITTKKKDKVTPAVVTPPAVTPTTALTKIIFTSTGASTETKSVKSVTKPQSPLASLNSIVANLGSSSLDTSVSQTKTSQLLNFPSSTFSSVFGSNLTTPKVNDKLNLAGGKTFVKKVTTQPNTTPVQSAPVAATTGFSKPIPISFGTPEPKSDNSTPKENTSKPVITFKAKETLTTPGQPLSLFTSNILETSVTGLGTSKVSQPATAGQSQPTNLGTSMTLSLKSSLPSPAATSQQTLFSFATQPLTTSISKPVTATELSESIQTFSFASKPMDAPTLPSMTEQFSAPSTTQSLDLSKLSSGLPLTNLVAEKPASSVPSSTFTFGQLSIPSTPLNFGKASAATPTSAVQQPAGINVNLPAGTTIEKQPLSSTSPPSTQTSSIFSTSPLLSSSMFGGATAGQISTSIFGGSAAAVTTSQSVLQDNNKVTSTTAEKTSTAQLSQLSFGESQSTSTNFSSAVSNLFSKPLTQATTSTTSPSFSQSAAATGTASPFAQSTAATGTASPFAQSTAATGTTLPSFSQSAAATGAASPFAQSAAATGSAPPSFAQSVAASGATSPSFAQPAAAAGATSSLFGQSGATTGVTSPIFGQSGLSTPANPVKIPPTTTVSSFFGAPQNQSISSPFSGSGTSSLSSMFGAAAVSSEPAAPGTGIGSGSSMFGGGTSNTSTPLFGAASPTSPSIFGGGAAKPAAPAFGGAPTFGSPTAPAFGGTATFGSKPVFGAQTSVFGASSPFGAAPAFGASPFGSSMPANPQDGNMSMGNTTFETLATQNGGLSFNSLAQKSPTQDKPAFSGGSSFTSWR